MKITRRQLQEKLRRILLETSDDNTSVDIPDGFLKSLVKMLVTGEVTSIEQAVELGETLGLWTQYREKREGAMARMESGLSTRPLIWYLEMDPVHWERFKEIRKEIHDEGIGTEGYDKYVFHDNIYLESDVKKRIKVFQTKNDLDFS